MKKTLLFCLVFSIFSFPGCKSFSLAPGQQLPAYPVTTAEGKEVNLGDKIHGPVLLAFFASWCGPCQEEVPDLNVLNETLKAKGFQVIGVAMDESAEDLAEFIKERNPSYPIYLDTKGLYKKPFKITGYPETVVLDANKKLVMVEDPYTEPTLKFVGARPWGSPEFISLFNKLLTH